MTDNDLYEWLNGFDCRDSQRDMILHCFDVAHSLVEKKVDRALIKKIIRQWLGDSDEIYTLKELELSDD